MRSPATLAWRNLAAHSLRSVLTALAITLGVAMVLVGVLLVGALGIFLPPRAQSTQRESGYRNSLEPFVSFVVYVGNRLSLQARLAIALAVLMAAAVGVLELVAIPIQRDAIETMLKTNLGVGVKWAAHAASTNSDLGLQALLRGRQPAPAELLGMGQALDLERLQELTERVRGDDVAYVALVDGEGVIALADQLALVDERVGAPADTGQNLAFQDALWRGEKVWVISAPLRQGGDGEPSGWLRVAVWRRGVEDFLNESRRLFLLAALAAALVGVLAAQAIGEKMLEWRIDSPIYALR